MKWVKSLLVFCLFYLLSAPYFYAQDAGQQNPSLSIPEIFSASKVSLNIIEENSIASNQKISDLQNEVLRWQKETTKWQNELIRHQENSKASEQALLTKFQDSENTLQSLSASFLKLSQEGKEKDGKILKLTETNAAQAQTIIIMGGILGAVLAYLIFRLVLWIKGGAAASLIKKLFRRVT
jgi:hypothetical protein